MPPAPGSMGPSATSPVATNAALYNFKLLEALRSGNTGEVQPYLDELKTAPEGNTGRLLGMAVRVASGKFHGRGQWGAEQSPHFYGRSRTRPHGKKLGRSLALCLLWRSPDRP